MRRSRRRYVHVDSAIPGHFGFALVNGELETLEHRESTAKDVADTGQLVLTGEEVSHETNGLGSPEAVVSAEFLMYISLVDGSRRCYSICVPQSPRLSYQFLDNLLVRNGQTSQRPALANIMRRGSNLGNKVDEKPLDRLLRPVRRARLLEALIQERIHGRLLIFLSSALRVPEIGVEVLVEVINTARGSHREQHAIRSMVVPHHRPHKLRIPI